MHKTVSVLLIILCVSLVAAPSLSFLYAEAKKNKGLTINVNFVYPDKKDSDFLKLLKNHPSWYKMVLSWSSDSGSLHEKNIDLNKFPKETSIKNFKVKTDERFCVGLNSGELDEGDNVCKIHKAKNKSEKVTFTITLDIHGK